LITGKTGALRCAQGDRLAVVIPCLPFAILGGAFAIVSGAKNHCHCLQNKPREKWFSTCAQEGHVRRDRLPLTPRCEGLIQVVFNCRDGGPYFLVISQAEQPV
jgi:hypothetical protein